MSNPVPDDVALGKLSLDQLHQILRVLLLPVGLADDAASRGEGIGDLTIDFRRRAPGEMSQGLGFGDRNVLIVEGCWEMLVG